MWDIAATDEIDLIEVTATKTADLSATKQDTPYETEEGCLSLTGIRKTTRHQNIEVEYNDSSWRKMGHARAERR